MDARVLVINPHPGPNPQFTEPLAALLASFGASVETVAGGAEGERLTDDADRVIVAGVPLDTEYSLSQPATRERAERDFGWLRDCDRPVLGICYGHQLLGQIHGGRVDALAETVNDPAYRLTVEDADGCALLAGTRSLHVFAEHRDYLAEVPASFRVLSQVHGVPYITWNPDTRACGMQFVPELSGDDGLRLLWRFLS